MKTVAALIVTLAFLPGMLVQAAAPKSGPAAKGAAKAEEPPAKIEGMEIAREGDRGFLGIQIVDSTFKLSFYDAKKKPIDPDAVRALLRWDPKYRSGDERVVLNLEGKALTSPRHIRPPYNFKLFITLLSAPAGGGDPVASEHHVIDFRQ